MGLDGTGKATTVQLATYIANCELYKLLLTRGYNITDFREDLKKVTALSNENTDISACSILAVDD